MKLNPYEAPIADSRDLQAAKARRFKLGVRMAVGSVPLPFLGWLIARVFIAMAAWGDPIPQTAMALGGLFFLAALAIAAVLFVYGIILAMTN